MRFSLLVLACALINSERAGAQIMDRLSGGLAAGFTPNLAEAFSSDQICPHPWAIAASARIAAALSARLQMEVLGEFFQGPLGKCVDTGMRPPVPGSGPYARTSEYYDDRLRDPPAVLSLRLGVTALSTVAIVARPYIGIGRLAGKGITVPEVGLSVIRGKGRVRLLFEMEGWAYSVPRQHVEERYLDGRLVQRLVSMRDIHAFTTVFRVGFASRAGRM
jgi:hypothetical protein